MAPSTEVPFFVIEYQGRDVSGLLYTASKCLFDLKFSIRDISMASGSDVHTTFITCTRLNSKDNTNKHVDRVKIKRALTKALNELYGNYREKNDKNLKGLSNLDVNFLEHEYNYKVFFDAEIIRKPAGFILGMTDLLKYDFNLVDTVTRPRKIVIESDDGTTTEDRVSVSMQMSRLTTRKGIPQEIPPPPSEEEIRRLLLGENDELIGELISTQEGLGSAKTLQELEENLATWNASVSKFSQIRDSEENTHPLNLHIRRVFEKAASNMDKRSKKSDEPPTDDLSREAYYLGCILEYGLRSWLVIDQDQSKEQEKRMVTLGSKFFVTRSDQNDPRKDVINKLFVYGGLGQETYLSIDEGPKEVGQNEKGANTE